MVAISPRAVAGVLGALVSFTTYSYIFVMPSSLAQKEEAASGYWGEPDSEFNWCELDYQLTPLVAEPVNTATGGLYMLVSALAWWGHAGYFKIETRIRLMLLEIALLGVGTVLFHATLRYSMQLLDELPIFYLILTAAWALYERGERPRHRWLPWLLVAWASSFTFGLLATQQKTLLHEVCRGTMVCTFSVCFIFIFWAAAKACGEHQQRTGSAMMHDLFSSSFLWFLVSMVSWIVDNTACDVLQRQRAYLNFHAWGWHCGSVGGMYYMFLAVLVQRQGVVGVRCKAAKCLGVFPVVRPRGKES